MAGRKKSVGSGGIAAIVLLEFALISSVPKEVWIAAS